MPRPFGRRTLRILAAVRDGARYGLDIVDRTGLPSGTVYPVLARLRRRGLLTSRWEDGGVAAREGRPRRKYHALTPEGVAALARAAERLGHEVRGVENLPPLDGRSCPEAGR